MISSTRLYKTISSNEISMLKIKSERKYYYITENDGDIKEIKEQVFENNSNEKLFQLIDEDYEWNPKQNPLILDFKLKIDNCNILFGKSGSCFEDAIIGIGLLWKPEKSKIKRCKKIGEICKNDKSKVFEVNSLDLEDISSNVSFKIFFYIVEPGKTNGNAYFGNEAGMIIYEQTLWTLILNGNGSIFPIYEYEENNGPLWRYICDINDISEDFFDSEHVAIMLNKKHVAYPFIHPKSNEYNTYFLNEVLSSAIAAIIISIREKQPKNIIDLSSDFENGSVLQALKYFNDKLNIKINDQYDELYKSVKIYVDKEL